MSPKEKFWNKKQTLGRRTTLDYERRMQDKGTKGKKPLDYKRRRIPEIRTAGGRLVLDLHERKGHGSVGEFLSSRHMFLRSYIIF